MIASLGNRSANCVFITFLSEGYDDIRLYERLGVAYLIAVARQQGHNCTQINVKPGKDSEIISRIASLTPHFVGLSLVSDDIQKAIVFGRLLRAKLGSDVHICAGGPLPTFATRELLEHPDWYFLDSVVRGEGEGIINQLIAKVLNKKIPHDLSGVATRTQPQSMTLSATAIEDLDSIPWPARDQLDDPACSMPVATILLSRGCTGRCTFCAVMNTANHTLKTKVWRGRTPEDIVREVECLISKYKVDTFAFEASTYEDPIGKIGKQRVRRIAELILERGLSIYYAITTQACSWTESDVDLLDLMHKSGLESAYIGVESGSDRMLKLMNKHSTVKDNICAIELFRKSSIYVRFGFIMFHPYAEWQDIEDNGNFILENMGHLFELFLTQFELYPGTEDVRLLAADNLVEPGYYENLDPLAYRYFNPQIGQLACSISHIFSGNNRKSLSLRAFTYLDVDLHVYLSRLRRAFGDDPLVVEALEECKNAIVNEQNSLTEFNAAVWEDFLTLGKGGQDIPSNMVESIEDRYAGATRQLKSIQLHLGIKLGRQGKVLRRKGGGQTGKTISIALQKKD